MGPVRHDGIAMGTDLDEDLRERMDGVRREGLERRLRRLDSGQGVEVLSEGRTLVNFSSNDYLGLAGHARLRAAALQALEQFGAGAGASRLICGSLAPYHELESALAAFKDTPAALCFSSGYATAVGTITALVGRDDLVVVDRLAHASLVDGARLSGAKLRVFEHNDGQSLERVLKRHGSGGKRRSPARSRALVITESVFSMDGDVAPLRELAELKERYGFWLMVDEAHATGVLGGMRRGLVDEFSLGDRVDVQMGTLGKALGAAGGYVAGSRQLITFLLNRARSFIFSTAPVPAMAAAARAGIECVQSGEGEQRGETLWRRVRAVHRVLVGSGWPVPPAQSPILPLMVGGERAAVELSEALLRRGMLVPAIRYPSVGRGRARLRLTVSALHTEGHVEQLAEALAGARAEVGARSDV